MRRLVKLTEEDVVLACLPLFHVFGMTCAMNAAIAAGAGLSLMARFDPAKAIERIRRDRVTVLEAVPTMYRALLSVADQFPPEATATLRTCVSGGAALPVAVLNDFEKTFDAVILEGYGLSETSPAVTFNHPDAERRPGRSAPRSRASRYAWSTTTGTRCRRERRGRFRSRART